MSSRETPRTWSWERRLSRQAKFKAEEYVVIQKYAVCIHLPAYLSISINIYLSIYPSTSLSICASIYLLILREVHCACEILDNVVRISNKIQTPSLWCWRVLNPRQFMVRQKFYRHRQLRSRTEPNSLHEILKIIFITFNIDFYKFYFRPPIISSSKVGVCTCIKNLSGKSSVLEARARPLRRVQTPTFMGVLPGAMYGSHTYTSTRLLVMGCIWLNQCRIKEN